MDNLSMFVLVFFKLFFIMKYTRTTFALITALAGHEGVHKSTSGYNGQTSNPTWYKQIPKPAVLVIWYRTTTNLSLVHGSW